MKGWRSLGGLSLVLLCLTAVGPAPAPADTADVRSAKATCDADRVCRFTVAVLHADTGWRHYADQYEILTPEGEVLATRVLAHPHVHEQPFIRSIDGVEIPVGIDEVIVRAHDNVHGYGGREKQVRIVVAQPAPEPGEDDAPSPGSREGAPATR